MEHNPDPTANGKPRSNGKSHGKSKTGTVDRVHPYHDEAGNVVFEVVRFKDPKGFRQRRPTGDGKHVWSLRGVQTVLYCLPALIAAPPDQPVYIVEGEKDVEALIAAGRLATCNPMGAGKWRDHYADALAGRPCRIIPDNDQAGRDHSQQVAQSLSGHAASVRVVELPGLPEKGDVSDFLASGGTVEQLDELAAKAPAWVPPVAPVQMPVPYVERDGATFLIVPGEKGPEEKRIAGFTARIVREITRHEDGETRKQFEIVATHPDGTKKTAVIDAADFESMAWVPAELGSKFSIEPGRGTRDVVRHALQVLSHRDSSVEYREVFTSLGWHSIDGKPVYLHAGGGIGADGPVAVHVEIKKALEKYRLPDPDDRQLIRDVEHTLKIVDLLGPGPVGAVVASVPFRAVLGPTRFVPHFSGTTGSYKTSAACVSARFFAPDLEYSNPMPAKWESTANALQRLLYEAGDVVLVIDNLIADGDHAARELGKADAVFNSQGDLAGRQRMRPDGTLAPSLDPRSTPISTGETDPQRRSALGRSLLVEFERGTVTLDGVKACHDAARAGHYARSMAWYIKHLAAPGKLETARQELRSLSAKCQEQVRKQAPDCHPRQIDAVADLAAAFGLFLRFAANEGAIAEKAADECFAKVLDKLCGLLGAQASIQAETDPGEVFLSLVRSLLASKRAVLSTLEGKVPEKIEPGACGWDLVAIGDRGNTDWRPAPGAARIGWVDDHYVYLDPETAYAAADRLARETHRSLGTQRQVLARLAESGRIQVEQATAGQRRTFTQRVTAEGSRRRAVHIPRDIILDLDSAGNSTSPTPF